MIIPGVPSLPIGVTLFPSIPFIVNDILNFLIGFGAAPWGIYQDGVPVVVADNVVSLDYKQDFAIADFQIEEGGFETYDKVETPYSARVRFSSGGSQANRQALLDSINAIAGTLELYDVVTPEAVYPSANVQSYELRRSAVNGVGLITVDVKLIEVRVTATAQFSNTKSPTAASPSSGGTVQGIDPASGSGSGNGLLKRIPVFKSEDIR